MNPLRLFFPRRRRRRNSGTAFFISSLLALSTGVYLWKDREKLPRFFETTLAPFIGNLSHLSNFSNPGVQSGLAPQVAPAGQWEVYFSPGGGATEAIIREIGRARQRIRVQVYTFTSSPIAKALATAHARGIDVQVILDQSQRTGRYTAATYLANQRVPVFIDAAHAITHDKMIILDGETVITGSFNFTKAAENRNSENLLILRDAKELAARYEAHWKHHRGHSQPYQRF